MVGDTTRHTVSSDSHGERALTETTLRRQWKTVKIPELKNDASMAPDGEGFASKSHGTVPSTTLFLARAYEREPD